MDDERGKERYGVCKALEDMRNRCREEGREEGRKEEESKFLWSMAQNGIELEKIALIAQRSTEVVCECLKKMAEERKMPMPL